MRSIISRKESLEILEKDLRRAALERHAADLNSATPEGRTKILEGIEREIRKEIRHRRWLGRDRFLP